jgi:threonine/homoserine/homoserine lactone efflux protein
MHPEILSIILFGIVAAYTPGPNNFVAFYSGFNFGIKKTLPHIMGVTLGFPFLLLCLALGLINVFKLYPLIQEILKYLGTLFLIYLAYKISFSGSTNQENKNKKPVKFIETFIFQFLNPKGVIASIIVVSTYIDPGKNFINYTTQIIILALLVSVTSITLWTFMGKFLRKFATNQKYINYFNYAMSLLLLLSIINLEQKILTNL